MNLPDTFERYREVWVVDTEFGTSPGDPVRPVCLAAKELRTGQIFNLWQDDLPRFSSLPIGCGEDDLFVSYQAGAECSFLLAQNWPLPRNVLCLYAEHQSQWSGREGQGKLSWSLLEALAHYGLETRDVETKARMVDLIISTTEYTDEQATAIQGYCLDDVLDEIRLFVHVVANAEFELSQALVRGEYMKCCAKIEHRGIPIDVAFRDAVRDNLWRISEALVTETDKNYGICKGLEINRALFDQWLCTQCIPWPRLRSGALDMQADTFHEMAHTFPEIKPLYQLKTTLTLLRKFPLTVGQDGRNRCYLNPFGSKTSRNQASTNKNVFGPSKWVRSLIKPAEGRAVAYIDFCQEEFAIAAYLSGDQNMILCYESGDPYLTWAKLTGAAPETATKETHKEVRKRYKVAVLALQYGAGLKKMALQMAVSEHEARLLLQEHRDTFHTFWEWTRKMGDNAVARQEWVTVLGWHHHLCYEVSPNQLLNFPIQSNAGDVLRVATIMAERKGIEVLWLVHDALLIEADADHIEEATRKTEEAMQEASSLVLRGDKVTGPRLRVESKIVRWPDRFVDEDGQENWELIMGLISKGTVLNSGV